MEARGNSRKQPRRRRRWQAWVLIWAIGILPYAFLSVTTSSPHEILNAEDGVLLSASFMRRDWKITDIINAKAGGNGPNESRNVCPKAGGVYLSHDNHAGVITKCARADDIQHPNGLNGTASLELEYHALSRIASRCSPEEIRHFPSIVDYAKGQYLRITSVGFPIFNAVRAYKKRKRQSLSTTGYPSYDSVGYPTYKTSELAHDVNSTAIITKSDAQHQIGLMLQCMKRASVWHVDFITPGVFCKNIAVALEDDYGEEEQDITGSVPRKLRIGILDFDLVFMEGYEDVDTKKYIEHDNWDSYALSFEAELLTCVLGKNGRKTNLLRRKREGSTIKSVADLSASPSQLWLEDRTLLPVTQMGVG